MSILRRLLDDLPLKDLRPFGDRYFHLRAILSSINELKQQGVAPDFTALVELIAQYAGLPELKQVLTFTEPPPEGENAPGESHQAVPGPTTTSHQYERVNRPGTTQQGKDQAMAAMLAATDGG